MPAPLSTSKPKKYWFLQTKSEGSRTIMKVLTGQTITLPSFRIGESEKVEDCNEAFTVACDNIVKNKAPIGTIFITDTLVKKTSYYQAGDLYVHKVIADIPIAHPDALQQFDEYCKEHGIDPDMTDSSGMPVDWEKPSSVSRKRTVLTQLQDNSKYNCPTLSEHGFIIPKDDWYLLLRNMKQQIPTLLIGQTGTGKTQLAALASKALGYALETFDMGGTQDPISVLLGVHRLKKGESIFDPSRFTRVLQKPNTTGLLDELSRASAAANNLLFPCLDERRTLYVDMAGTDDIRDIPINNTFCFIATANMGAEYSGTNLMDRALQDRFIPLELEYLTIKQESDLLKHRCNITEPQAAHVATIANTLRNIYSQDKISTFVSTRATLRIGELIRDGFKVVSSIEKIIVPLFEQAERETVKIAITSR